MCHSVASSVMLPFTFSEKSAVERYISIFLYLTVFAISLLLLACQEAGAIYVFL